MTSDLESLVMKMRKTAGIAQCQYVLRLMSSMLREVILSDCLYYHQAAFPQRTLVPR